MYALVVGSVGILKPFEGVESYEIVSRLIIIKDQQVSRTIGCGMEVRGNEGKDLGICSRDCGATEH